MKITDKKNKTSSDSKDKSDYGTLTDVPGSNVDRDKLTQSLVP